MSLKSILSTELRMPTHRSKSDDPPLDDAANENAAVPAPAPSPVDSVVAPADVAQPARSAQTGEIAAPEPQVAESDEAFTATRQYPQVEDAPSLGSASAQNGTEPVPHVPDEPAADVPAFTPESDDVLQQPETNTPHDLSASPTGGGRQALVAKPSAQPGSSSGSWLANSAQVSPPDHVANVTPTEAADATPVSLPQIPGDESASLPAEPLKRDDGLGPAWKPPAASPLDHSAEPPPPNAVTDAPDQPQPADTATGATGVNTAADVPVFAAEPSAPVESPAVEASLDVLPAAGAAPHMSGPSPEAGVGPVATWANNESTEPGGAASVGAVAGPATSSSMAAPGIAGAPVEPPASWKPAAEPAEPPQELAPTPSPPVAATEVPTESPAPAADPALQVGSDEIGTAAQLALGSAESSKPEVRVPRSPVPPVRKLDATPVPGRVAAPDVPVAGDDAEVLKPAAAPSTARAGLSRSLRLPSLTRSGGKSRPDSESKKTRGRRAKRQDKSGSGAAVVDVDQKRASRFGIPASLGVYGLRGRDTDEPSTPKSKKRGSSRLAVPSVSSFRGMHLSLPGLGRDGGVLVGLDIQPGSAVAARVSRNGRLHVEDATTIQLPAGVVREGEVVDSEALGAALREMFEQSGFPRRVRVGVAGPRCVMRTLEVPPLKDKKELAQAVAFTASQEMPMPLESALTDFHALGQIETPTGPRERIVFVAAHQEPIGKLQEALRRAGVTAGGIDLSAFALIRALHTPADDEGDGCQIYLNVDGLTNIVIADGPTCLFTRVASVGAESMAGELAGERSITLEEARRELIATNLLDLDNAGTVDARTVLRDGLRDVGTEVRTALDFHGSQGGQSVSGIVLSGAIAHVRGFAEELGQSLGYDVTTRQVDIGSGSGLGGVPPSRLAVAAGLSVAEVPR